MTYDAAGNLISTTDAAGVVTETATYDSMGRVNTLKDALGMTTTYSYDTMGNILQAVKTLNADNSHKTTFTYDTLGRMTSVTDPLEGITKATYDKQGNISTITDANSGVTEYRYDKMGQLLAEISPLGSKTSYTYNAAGLLTESVNARNQSTKYTYDKAGRITSMTDELGTTSYTYDPNGNILTVTDADGTITREYDALNRVTKYTDARGNTVGYGYDELGNLIYLEYPGGEIVRCSYYKNGWLQTVTDPAGKVTKYTYDARGNLTHTERPNGTEEICEYNDAGLLVAQKDIRKKASGTGEVLTEYHYTYDESGNIISVSGTETTGTKEGISALSGSIMTYGADNRLISYNGEEVRYDADGNMIYGPVNGVMSELTYDCRNRLISAGGVTYTYDAENNRIGMENDRYRESYVVDTVSSSLSRVLTADVYSIGNPNVVSSRTLCVYGNGLICEKEDDNYKYHHYNNLGSTMKLTDAEGGVISSFTYGTYGELLSGSTGYTRFLYNGRCGVMTDDNGLYYMRQRYYSPELKRFVNQDVVKGSISNSQSLNRYSYVQGNPLSYIDPFGLSPLYSLFGTEEGRHYLCSVFSMVPGMNFGFGMLEIELYMREGNTAMAIMTGLGCVSMLSGCVAGVTGGIVGKVSGYICALSSLAASSMGMTMFGSEAIRLGKEIWGYYRETGIFFGGENKERWGQLGGATLGAGLSLGGAVVSGHMLGSMLKADGVLDKFRSGWGKSGVGAALEESVGIEGGNNAGEVKYRIGQVVKETEKTYEMGLNPELYANAVAEKYGINLKGSGQNITIQYDPSLAVSLYGKSSESNPTVIVIGKAALLNEATLANTIAHELSHCRDFIRGAGMQHPELHKPHGNADSVNISGEQRTVYGAGNALDAYIKGER